MRDGADAMTVNWLEIEIINAKGKLTYRNSFVTGLPVDRDNVAELAACGRARWKIENESFNVPQEQRLQPRAQLRPRQGDALGRPRRPEPPRLRPAAPL
jgi:hypothetical protein